ncbi:MAG: tetratricopeptide repeat protein [Bryobacteraceae bacterium]
MPLRAPPVLVLTLWFVAVAQAQVLGNSTNPSQSAVFFSGEVMLEDGSVPPTTAVVQQICDGRLRRSVATDTQGRFSFKVDGSGDKYGSDATQAPPQPADLNKPLGSASQYSQPVTSSLRDCELQAVLAGFSSTRVAIDVKDTLDNARVGTIILHPITRAGEFTISATTLAAPSHAKKSFDKGLVAMKAQKWADAVNQFNAAVKVYPKFAAAWYELGLAYEALNQLREADTAWLKSLDSDPKYGKPYQNLTALAYRQGNWQGLEDYSSRWLKLDPDDFPAAYLFDAFAKAKLNRMDDAEVAARHGLLIDKEHTAPKLDFVLGIILMQRHEYAESAKCLRSYLELVPDASDAPAIREQVATLDAAAARKQ